MSGLSRAILTACRVPFSTEAESGLSGIIAPGCCFPTSVEPMAARLAPSTTRTTHKKLLNFVSDGAWSDEAVLVAMRREILPALEAHGAVRRWIETGMAKKGTHSVGVARQDCGELGKIENCQVLVSLSVANEVAALPIAALSAGSLDRRSGALPPVFRST